MDTLIRRPFDPTHKRYYLVRTDVRRAMGDNEELGLDECNETGWRWVAA